MEIRGCYKNLNLGRLSAELILVLFLLFRSVKSECKEICQKNNGMKSRLGSVIQQAYVILGISRFQTKKVTSETD